MQTSRTKRKNKFNSYNPTEIQKKTDQINKQNPNNKEKKNKIKITK